MQKNKDIKQYPGDIGYLCGQMVGGTIFSPEQGLHCYSFKGGLGFGCISFGQFFKFAHL